MIISLTQTSLHFRQHQHAKTSREELKLALFCLSHIMHRTVTDICGSLSVASDVRGRQATAGLSDLGQSEESTELKGDNPLCISARSKFNEEVRLGKKINLPWPHHPHYQDMSGNGAAAMRTTAQGKQRRKGAQTVSLAAGKMSPSQTSHTGSQQF